MRSHDSSHDAGTTTPRQVDDIIKVKEQENNNIMSSFPTDAAAEIVRKQNFRETPRTNRSV